MWYVCAMQYVHISHVSGMHVGESTCVGYSLILGVFLDYCPPWFLKLETDDFGQDILPVSSQDLQSPQSPSNGIAGAMSGSQMGAGNLNQTLSLHNRSLIHWAIWTASPFVFEARCHSSPGRAGAHCVAKMTSNSLQDCSSLLCAKITGVSHTQQHLEFSA